MAESPTPPQMPGFSSPTPPAARQTGLAVATLVLGIIGLVACLPAGIIAIVTGIIALVRIGNQPQRYGGQGMAIAGLVCGCASIITTALLASILVSSLARARELSKRIVCATNMEAIGVAMGQYAADNNFQGQIGLDELIHGGYLTRDQTICPASGLDLSNYIVARRPAQERPANETILVYEPLSNHGGEGGVFLYGDGHVMFNLRPLYDELVAEIRSSGR